MFISFLYVFRATMCSSSGETTVFMRHLILVMLYNVTVWYAGAYAPAYRTVTYIHNDVADIEDSTIKLHSGLQ